MSSLRRWFLALSLAYIILITVCLQPNTTTAALSAPRPNRPSTTQLNSPHRIRVPVQNATPRSGKREGELLIRFRRGASQAEQKFVADLIGAREFRPLRGRSRLVRVNLGPNQTLESAALTLQNQPLVEAAEPNYLIYLDNAGKAKSAKKGNNSGSQQSTTPNDPRFNEQWALQNIGGNTRLFGADTHVTSVWSYSTGRREFTVAVIDSGIDFEHPDLKNQQWKNQKETRDGIDQDHNGYVDDIRGWDFIKDNHNVADENGHGTNVAGIIAAEGNNGIGIAGVLWKASLMSLRVLDANGIGDTASAIEALDYATEHGAQVINLSWGSDAKSLFLKDAIRRSTKYGAVVVCSAGNDARDLERHPYYPASFDLPNLVSVGASNPVDGSVPVSNFGTQVPTIAAPGAEVLTTKANLRGSAIDESGIYEVVTGTSAAAAIVSGVIGLFKLTSFEISPEGIKNGLIQGARASYELNGKNRAGGVVSLSGALIASEPEGTRKTEKENNPANANDSDSRSSINPSILNRKEAEKERSPHERNGGVQFQVPSYPIWTYKRTCVRNRHAHSSQSHRSTVTVRHSCPVAMVRK